VGLLSAGVYASGCGEYSLDLNGDDAGTGTDVGTTQDVATTRDTSTATDTGVQPTDSGVKDSGLPPCDDDTSATISLATTETVRVPNVSNYSSCLETDNSKCNPVRYFLSGRDKIGRLLATDISTTGRYIPLTRCGRDHPYVVSLAGPAAACEGATVLGYCSTVKTCGMTVELKRGAKDGVDSWGIEPTFVGTRICYIHAK
jgi:hypothetical protein